MIVIFAIDVHLLDDATPAMDRLRRLDAGGKVKLGRTDTVDSELERATDPDKRNVSSLRVLSTTRSDFAGA
jgi:hypothetical protein